MSTRYTSVLLCGFLCLLSAHGQVVINEASSRNFRVVADEDGNYPDWIELHNTTNEWVNLAGYSLTDDINNPTQWTFPVMGIAPHGYLVVFCSGKDRMPRNGQTTVAAVLNYSPTVGWNTHVLSIPFNWDGSSNILIETCATNTTSTTLNPTFNQTTTTYPSSAFAYSDSVSSVCGEPVGNVANRRPVIRLNGLTIGTNDWTNNATGFPSPYGNWYGGTKHAMLIRADELVSAGLSAGNINSIAFDVVATQNAVIEEVDLRFGHVAEDAVSAEFIPWYGAYQFHTNFGLGRGGETVYLFSPGQQQLSQLYVEQEMPGHSNGSWPDGSSTVQLFDTPTPGASNNTSDPYADYAEKPTLSVASTIGGASVTVDAVNPNLPPTTLRYTLDGSDPTASSPPFIAPITMNEPTVLKVRAFVPGLLPSKIETGSYLIGAQHSSPVLSITTAQSNLYGATGMFDNWWKDDEIPAHAEYFLETGELAFSQRTGMQMDGGHGGSRSFPQHSFRLEFDNGTLGAGSVDLPLIPDRPQRTEYSRIYLRNGSNQYQILPHKDAAQVKMMAGATKSYYTAWTPVTVYINGDYFGLYEMREKFDTEYFRTLEGADGDSLDLLGVSSWNGQMLRANEGSTDGFWQDMSEFRALDPASPTFWEQADASFDMEWYTDYIFGQQWMATTDWPINNIKIYRSNSTGHRWRFCTVDLETGMAPNGQSGPHFNGLVYAGSQDPEIPYTYIWQRGIQNNRYHDYYINRAADIMNSAFLDERIQGIGQEFFDLARPDMGDQFLRWGGPDTSAQLLAYEANNAAFLSDLSQRTPIMRDDIQEFFGLPRQLDVVLDVHPEGAGRIRISTLRPENYPWHGVYFDGVPVHIEALANDGFLFSHWAGNGLIGDTLNTLFLDTLAADAITFDAFFVPDGSGLRETNMTDFAIYPNPTERFLYVSTDKAFTRSVSYHISDPRGVVVQDGTLAPGQLRTPLNVGHLANGPYQLILVNASGQRQVLRFVKL